MVQFHKYSITELEEMIPWGKRHLYPSTPTALRRRKTKDGKDRSPEKEPTSLARARKR